MRNFGILSLDRHSDDTYEIDPSVAFSPPPNRHQTAFHRQGTMKSALHLPFNWNGCTVECVIELKDIRDEWRDLQTTGFSTPYQHLNWVQARVATLKQSSEHKIGCMYGVVRSADQQIVMLFPLKIYTMFGVRCATILGGKHANYQMPVFDRHAFETLTPEIMNSLLTLLSQSIRSKFGVIDLFLFENQPQTWMGSVNPLAALKSEPSPSDAYGLALERDFNTTISNVMSKDTFKKLRKKLKNLEAMPDFKLIHAQTEDEVKLLLSAFFEQKRVRFAQLGIENPFDSVETQHFLTQLFMSGRLITPRTASLNALSVDGKIIAVVGGVMSQDHFSGMITSYDPNPIYARNSPGQVLFLKMIELKAAQGLKYFDFGVGEAAYKDIFAGYTIPLRDSIIPVTLKGKIACAMTKKQHALKRKIKRTPLLWHTFQGLRVLKARVKALLGKK